MKKMIIVLMIVSILIVGGCVGEKEESPLVQSCIDVWDSQNLDLGHDFTSGDVFVGFNKEITEEEAMELFDSYELKFISEFPKTYPSKIGLVRVPTGSEFEWICILEVDPKIKYADLNYIITIDS